MTLTIVGHPLAEDLLTTLRDRETSSKIFRVAAKKLATVLVIEATRDLPTTASEVHTPLERAAGARVPPFVAVSILRAGLPMAEAVTDLFPRVRVGHLGLERDEETLRPTWYYEKLPSIEGQHVMLLDPMLATGGSALAACERIKSDSPASIRFVCIVAAPEGAEAMEKAHPEIPIYAATLDRQLDERGYILPGLGDFGDRLYGTE